MNYYNGREEYYSYDGQDLLGALGGYFGMVTRNELLFERLKCFQVCSLAGQFSPPFHGSSTDSVATLQYHMARRRRRVIEL